MNDVEQIEKLLDFFDPYNQEHLNAYKYLQDMGTWPEDFYNLMIERDIPLPPNWQIIIQSKIADAWIDEKLKEG